MAANWTLTQVLNQLNSGQKWSGNTITYSFPSTASGLFSQGEATGFRAVNATQQQWMTLALATWDDLIPQSMAAGTPGQTNIEFGYTSTNIGYAHAYYPTTGSAWFNATEDTLVRTSVGEYGFQTFIHEIGHALGLNHMGNYNGDGNWAPSSFQDSVVLSIMSYFGPRYAAPNYSAEVMQADWVDAGGTTHSPQTPMLNDIMAIQTIYGTSTTTRLDNTVYGFSSTVGGATGQIYDFTVNRNPILTIFDSGGSDTLNVSGWSTPSRIDLHAGAFSSVNDMTNNIAIAYNTTIENAIGGGGADVIIGNDAANRLEGGGGNDELNGSAGDDTLIGGPGNDNLDGGDGTDTAVFEGSFASYTITVNANSITFSGAASGTDTVTGVENFQFADLTRTIGQLSPGTDSSPPQLQSLSPADNSGNAPVGANLVLGFNEPVKAGAGNISIFNSDGTLYRSISANDGTQVRFSGNTATVDPSVNLVAGRGYYVTVDAGALVDLAGNAFAGLTSNGVWNFNTATSDTTPPQLVALSPTDDATGVAIGADLVLTFNENVAVGSGSIVIRSGSQVVRTIAVTDTSQVTVDGSQVRINPSSDLAANIAYSVTVDAGAFHDAAGNNFAGVLGNTAWTFTTAVAGTDDFPLDPSTPGIVVVNGAALGGRIEVAGDEDLFRVDLIAGVHYTFTLQRTPGGLSDPYLVLFNPALAIVADDDDSAGAGNSRISFTAAVSGTHYLAALDYSELGTGGYTVSASTLDAQAPTLVARSPADDTSQVNAGADLVMTFSEPVFAGNGRIQLLNASNQVIREIRANDSNAVTITGSIVTLNPGANLPDDTAIVVHVDADAFHDASGNDFTGISNNTAWNFRTAAVAVIDDYPMSTSTSGVVLPNGPLVPGRIDKPNDGDLFKLTLAAGVTYRFDMVAPQTESVDPFLALYGLKPEVALIASDDDSGPLPYDARLYFTPSANGEYYLAAFDYAEATGSYTLQASVETDDFLGATTTSGTVTINQAATSGTINAPSDIDMFRVSLTAGWQYSFDLKSVGNADTALSDPYLVLLDAAGKPLAYDDDTGGNLNSQITYTAPSTGNYYLAASDFDIGAGRYEISAYTRTVIPGTGAPDTLTGTGGRDTLVGGSGNDTLKGGAGDDILEGDAGLDTAVFGGSRSAYTIGAVEGGWVITALAGNEGRDLLYGVERVDFADRHVALDIDGNAGTTAKILGAVFGKSAVANEAYVGIGLDLLDAGMSYPALMQLALEARLGPNPSNVSVVNLLYGNVVGVQPGADRDYFVGLITSAPRHPGRPRHLAAETDLNAANIGLTGLAEHGIGAAEPRRASGENDHRLLEAWPSWFRHRS